MRTQVEDGGKYTCHWNIAGTLNPLFIPFDYFNVMSLILLPKKNYLGGNLESWESLTDNFSELRRSH